MARPEPWLVCYGLLGLTQSGLVPVLMPLVARNDAGAGVLFSAGGLTALAAATLAAIGASLWLDRYWLRQSHVHADGMRSQYGAGDPRSTGAARAESGDGPDRRQ